MRRLYFKQFTNLVLFLLSFALFTNCTANKGTTNYSINNAGVIEAQPDTMLKDAIRLKGKIVSKSGSNDMERIYDFEVTEVVRFGATFSSDEPQIGDKVKLYTPKEVKFKKGNEIMLDAMTRRSEELGTIILNMITK